MRNLTYALFVRMKFGELMMSGERTHTSLLTSKHHVLTSQGSPIPVYGSFIPH